MLLTIQKIIFFFFFRNVPDARGRYMGQAGYGYVSFERFWGRQQYVEEINSKFKHHQFPDKTCPTGLWRLLQKSTRAKRLQLILTSTSPQVPWPFPETMISPFFFVFLASIQCFRSCNRGSDSHPWGRSTKSRQRWSHREDSLWLARLATDYRFESGLLESIKIFWVSLLSLCEHFWPYLTVCSSLP